MKRPNARGSVYKTATKSTPWRAVGPASYDENGKAKRKTIGNFRTKREAEAALSAFQDATGRIVVSEDYAITVGEITARWIEFRRSEHKNKKLLSAGTIEQYDHARNRISSIHNLRFVDLSIDVLQKCFTDLVVEGLSRSAVKQSKSLLTQVYDYAIPRGLATVNLASYVRIDAKASKPTQRFTSKEIDLLFDSLSTPWVDSILIMIYTAMRPTELLTLPKSRVNLEEGYIVWGIKTDAGINRLIPIHSRIAPLVEARLLTPGDLLIMRTDSKTGKASPVDRRDYSRRIFKNALKAVGIDRPLTPRSCRKTGSSLFAEAGLSESARLKIIGHTDIALTEKVYTELEIDFLRTEIEKVKNK